jgi:hypothetical protein
VLQRYFLPLQVAFQVPPVVFEMTLFLGVHPVKPALVCCKAAVTQPLAATDNATNKALVHRQ